MELAYPGNWYHLLDLMVYLHKQESYKKRDNKLINLKARTGGIYQKNACLYFGE